MRLIRGREVNGDSKKRWNLGGGHMGPRRIGTSIGGRRSASNGEETERNKWAEMERGLKWIQR